MMKKLIGKVNFFQLCTIGNTMRYTFPIRYKQLHSGVLERKLSTQRAQVLCVWEIQFSCPVEQEIPFMKRARHTAYIDGPSVQGDSITGCLSAVPNGTHVREFGKKGAF